jgi:hypothetical protein
MFAKELKMTIYVVPTYPYDEDTKKMVMSVVYKYPV